LPPHPKKLIQLFLAWSSIVEWGGEVNLADPDAAGAAHVHEVGERAGGARGRHAGRPRGAGQRRSQLRQVRHVHVLGPASLLEENKKKSPYRLPRVVNESKIFEQSKNNLLNKVTLRPNAYQKGSSFVKTSFRIPIIIRGTTFKIFLQKFIIVGSVPVWPDLMNYRSKARTGKFWGSNPDKCHFFKLFWTHIGKIARFPLPGRKKEFS
jgi:hypothetical protein